MSDEKSQPLLKAIAKRPLQSKKFIAAMIWNIIWLLLIGIGILKDLNADVLQSMVWACATSCGLYLGGQSFVDSMIKYGAARFGSSIQKDQ